MSRGDASRRRAMSLACSVIAAVAIATCLSVASQPLFVTDGLAAWSVPDEPPGITADAPGRWGCVPEAAPTPTPVPARSPGPVAGAAGGIAAFGGPVAFAAGMDAPPVTTLDALPVGLAGIDISRYQQKVDLAAARAAGLRFVFTKATQGTTSSTPGTCATSGRRGTRACPWARTTSSTTAGAAWRRPTGSSGRCARRMRTWTCCRRSSTWSASRAWAAPTGRTSGSNCGRSSTGSSRRPGGS